MPAGAPRAGPGLLAPGIPTASRAGQSQGPGPSPSASAGTQHSRHTAGGLRTSQCKSPTHLRFKELQGSVTKQRLPGAPGVSMWLVPTTRGMWRTLVPETSRTRFQWLQKIPSSPGRNSLFPRVLMRSADRGHLLGTRRGPQRAAQVHTSSQSLTARPQGATPAPEFVGCRPSAHGQSQSHRTNLDPKPFFRSAGDPAASREGALG